MNDPLLEIIPGDINQRTQNVNRHTDLNRHLIMLKREFIGKPLVCYRVAEEITYIRREVDLHRHINAFNELIDKYLDVLLLEYDLRWLLSVCDTYVDIGDVTRSAIAMCIVIEIKYLNIDATILDLVGNRNITDDQITKYRAKRPTWGGMITCDLRTGDMIYNMQYRVDKVIQSDPLLFKIWNEIKSRIRDDMTIPVNKLADANRDKLKKKFFL